jgi:hypothetical protein
MNFLRIVQLMEATKCSILCLTILLMSFNKSTKDLTNIIHKFHQFHKFENSKAKRIQDLKII